MSQLFKIVKTHYLKHWVLLAFGAVSLLITSWVTVKIPQMSKDVLNAISDGSESSELERIALIIISLGILQILVRTLSRVLIFWPARKAERSIKTTYFSRFLDLPQQFFDRFGKGDLISRMANDIGQLRGFLGFGVLQGINFIMLAIVAVSKMLETHVGLTLACLLPLSLMAFVTQFAMPKLHTLSKTQQETLSNLTNRITESFYHVHSLQATGTTKAMSRLVEKDNQALYQINIKLVTFRMLLFPLLTLLSGISYLVILAYGGSLIIKGQLTVGDLMAFNVYIGLLSFPLTAIGILIASYQRAKVAAERLGEIEDAEIEGPLPASNDLTVDNSILAVNDLSFSFPGKSEPNLVHINFELKQGEKLGIAGPVGAGKSTLLNLLTRIYSPPAGTVYVGGKDICGFDPTDLRKRFSYALQTPQLFSASLMENIRLGKPYPLPAVEHACEQADILSDIEDFSSKFDTVVGEQGVRLSGGQKQRLALARAWITDAEIMLLDDVLSAVDHTTEAKITDALRKLQKTTLIVSHRESVLKSCDKLLILNAGNMVAFGPSHQILEKYKESILEKKQ